MKNPWLGLSSYTEESLNDYQFNGRSEAIVVLSSLISRNLFVTLYGRSGIGKTSLLQAGVYPVFRKKGMFPVTIRLNDVSDTGLPASEKLWDLLIKDLENKGCRYVPCDKNDPCKPDFSKTLVLRELFSAGRFVDSQNQEIIPVLVLDQFEEVLYHAPLASKLLLKQFYALIDDNYDTTIGHPSWHEETNFRIVVSIREDDLYLFEDFIDTLNCPDLKENRYRLLPLSDDEAKEVILNPAKDVFEEGRENEIAEKIISLLHENGKSMNTLMLSLICHVLFEQAAKRNRKIMLSDLDSYKDIIETYYLEATKNLPKSQLYYLEDKLIDDQGRRTTIYLADLEKHAPLAKQFLTGTNNRILNQNQGRVEFIHDQLAAAVFKIKSTRKSKRTKQIGIAALIITLLIIFFISFSKLPGNLNHNNKIYINSAENIKNNTYVDSIAIDDEHIHNIVDCPNLKHINIKSQLEEIYIINCRNLTSVNYPQNFKGIIKFVNSPYLKDDSVLIRSENLPVGYNYSIDWINYYFLYDSIQSKLTLHRLGGKKNEIEAYFPFAPFNDSIKNLIDFYVPYGYKNQIQQLESYHPFRSINELPVYCTWQINFDGMIAYFLAKENKLISVITIFGIILVQFLFWFSAYNLYHRRKNTKNSPIIILLYSFFYGIGMSLIVIIAFMAFYWAVYNWLYPWNQLIAIISGTLGALLCIILIYGSTFYALYLYFKEKGVKGFIKDCKNAIAKSPQNTKYLILEIWKSLKNRFNILKSHIIKVSEIIKNTIIKLICAVIQKINEIVKSSKQFLRPTIYVSIAIIAILTVGFGWAYIYGKKSRENYLIELNKLFDKNETHRALAIIDQLKSTKESRLYPFFNDTINAIKDTIAQYINRNSNHLIAKISPATLNELSEKQNMPLITKSLNKILDISKDASAIAFNIELQSEKYPRDQIVILDLNNMYIDTISNTGNYYNFRASFSPSANYIITANDSWPYKRYIYSLKDKNLNEIPNPNRNFVSNLVMINDSIFYYLNYPTLYKTNTLQSEEDVKIQENSELRYSLHYINPDFIAGLNTNNKIVIYNTKIKKRNYISETSVGDIRAINFEYAITDKGLFDIREDSIIYEDWNLYPYNNDVVKLSQIGQAYILTDLNGHERAFIPLDSEGLYYSEIFIKGNSIISKYKDTIFVYKIDMTKENKYIITEDDKRIFNLK